MVHIALALFLVKTLKLLTVGNGTERADCHNLRLTACENTRTVNSRKNSNLSCQRTNFIKLSSVNALSVVKQPAANNEFLQFVHTFVNHSNLFGVLLVKLCVNFRVNRLQTLLADILVVSIHCIANLFDSKRRDCVIHIVVNFHTFKRKLGLANLRLNVLDEGDKALHDFLVTRHNRLKHCVIVNFVCASLNHNNFLLGRSNREVEVALCALFSIGHKNNFAVNKTNGNTADRSVPRNIGNRNGD